MSLKVDCPCCGKQMDNDRPEFLMYVKLSEIQSSVLEKLVTDYPKTTCMESLISFVFAFDEEGLYVENSIRHKIVEINKKIKSYGWTIFNISGKKSGRGNKAQYLLQKI